MLYSYWMFSVVHNCGIKFDIVGDRVSYTSLEEHIFEFCKYFEVFYGYNMNEFYTQKLSVHMETKMRADKYKTMNPISCCKFSSNL